MGAWPNIEHVIVVDGVFYIKHCSSFVYIKVQSMIVDTCSWIIIYFKWPALFMLSLETCI